jgi:hypothetical protein
VKVDTPSGSVNFRYFDIAAVRIEPREVVEAVQVGKLTAAGVPVSRERNVSNEIGKDRPSIIQSFIGYNR